MKTKVLIVGGGIAGLALALKLGKRGLPCVIIDPFKPEKYDFTKHGGRTAAIMGESLELLKELGVWNDIERETAPLETMRIIDDSSNRAEPVQIDFKARESGGENFGYNIPNSFLRELLFNKVKKEKSVKVIVPTKLESLEQHEHHIMATLDNGKTVEADLVVGSDGRNSFVRSSNNINHKEIDYNQIAITCVINHQKPHENTSVEHHRSGGPFTTVPMPSKGGKHYSSIVWVEKTEDAKRYIALDKESFTQSLQDKTRGLWGNIKLENTPESWPLKALLANDMIAPRTVLIAEAGHAMSPIGAQGLNLSLRDVLSLGNIIIETAQLGEDIGSQVMLEKYKKSRHLDWQTRFHGVDRYNKIVSNNISLLRGVRRAGLKTLNTIPAFKNIAMQIGLKPAA